MFTAAERGIHAHVLPNGLVLMWGGATTPASPSTSFRPPRCMPAARPPRRLSPHRSSGIRRPGSQENRQQPTLPDGSAANLFCSGHAFLPDGRLFVAGGHLADGPGVNQTTMYDPVADKWTPGPAMNAGRWYPTAVTRLPDGGVLVLSGSKARAAGVPNIIPQVWRPGPSAACRATRRALSTSIRGCTSARPGRSW